MHPDRRVDDVAQLRTEVTQTTTHMLAGNVELRLEGRGEDGLTFFEPHNACDGREHEISGAYAERGAVHTTKGIVALNLA
jgi:hypothetical protein